MEKLARHPRHHLTVKAEREQLLAARLVEFDGKSAQNDIKGRLALPGTTDGLHNVQYDSADPKADPAPDPHDNTLRVDVVGSGSICFFVCGEEIDAEDDLAVGAGGKVVKADAAVAAHVDTGLVGENNGITWTAREPGEDGDDLSVTIVDPPGNNVALSVDVDGDEIVVTAATDGASAITSTAAQVMAAVLEHDVASQLVATANKGASTGAGVVKAVAKTNLAGGADSSDAEPIGKAFTSGDANDYIEGELY
jgi:hypothetical protein